MHIYMCVDICLCSTPVSKERTACCTQEVGTMFLSQQLHAREISFQSLSNAFATTAHRFLRAVAGSKQLLFSLLAIGHLQHVHIRLYLYIYIYFFSVYVYSQSSHPPTALLNSELEDPTHSLACSQAHTHIHYVWCFPVYVCAHMYICAYNKIAHICMVVYVS